MLKHVFGQSSGLTRELKITRRGGDIEDKALKKPELVSLKPQTELLADCLRYILGIAMLISQDNRREKEAFRGFASWWTPEVP